MNKVSVVMPAYNAENFISQSIESVLTQTYSNIELVIVNDGSTDNTPSIIESYVTQYPGKIIFVNKSINEGTAKTISRALKETTGDYISWLSADDLYFDTMIESQLNYLLSNPNMDACFSKSVIIDENNNLKRIDYFTDDLAKTVLSDSHWIYHQLLFYGNAFHGCSLLGKKKIFTDTGDFNPNFKYAHDYEYWLRLASISNIGFVNEHNVMGREYDTQISKQGHNEEDAIRVFSSFVLQHRDSFCSLMERAGISQDKFVLTIHQCFINRIGMYATYKPELLALLEEYQKIVRELM